MFTTWSYFSIICIFSAETARTHDFVQQYFTPTPVCPWSPLYVQFFGFMSNWEYSKRHKHMDLARILLQRELAWILLSNQRALAHRGRRSVEPSGWGEGTQHFMASTGGWWMPRTWNMLCVRSSPRPSSPCIRNKKEVWLKPMDAARFPFRTLSS